MEPVQCTKVGYIKVSIFLFNGVRLTVVLSTFVIFAPLTSEFSSV